MCVCVCVCVCVHVCDKYSIHLNPLDPNSCSTTDLRGTTSVQAHTKIPSILGSYIQLPFEQQMSDSSS